MHVLYTPICAFLRCVFPRGSGRALVLTAASTACSGHLTSAVTSFHHADYAHAAREFRRAYAEGLAASDAPRYHLYCGLNHLALGNASLAIVHLTRARTTLDHDAAYFSVDERARLLSAWRALGRMPGQSLIE